MTVTLAGSSPTPTLAATALERARILAPLVLFATVTSLVSSESVGVDLSGAVIAFNAISISVLVGICITLWRRQVPERWAHPVLTLIWWLPVAGTLLSQYFSHSPLLAQVLLLEISCAAILLHTNWVIGTQILITIIWVPLTLRDGGPEAPSTIMTGLLAQVTAIVFHVLMRRSLVRAETLRLEAAETSERLAQQVAELERSHADLARMQDQLQHAQRMEAVGTLAAGLAHDMNNVLGAIMSFAGLVLDTVQQPAERADLEQIVAEAERGAALTRGLLAFSRRGQYRKQVLVLDDIVREVLPLFERMLPKSIEVRSQLSGGTACVEGDPVQLGQALVNFALNAAHAMPHVGTLELAADVVELDLAAATVLALVPGRYARLRVTDTGVGMDDAVRRRVFEPFFTTKPMGKGTGLGLSTVWGVAQAHRGAVSVASKLGKGTTFWLHLPLTTADPPRAAAPVIPTTDAELPRTTVLVIDDEAAVRRGTQRTSSGWA
ncbi:MAG: ATP-binding protein [Kofleriaceae bacterium]